MCGIVGILSSDNTAQHVLNALEKLEYRGYDSAGIAVNTEDGLVVFKETGKLSQLTSALPEKLPSGTAGIGHTRWATHGAPERKNAHPHQTDNISLVHNGIISNDKELRAALQEQGVKFSSDTDTETILHTLDRLLRDNHTPLEALTKTLEKIEGSFAIAAILKHQKDTILVARRGSPLVIGFGEGIAATASDLSAFPEAISQAIFLEDGDFGEVSPTGVRLFQHNGEPVDRPKEDVLIKVSDTCRGSHKSFMEKEILEQSSILRQQIAVGMSSLEDLGSLPIDFSKISKINLSACGTAYYACLVAKHWFKSLSGIDVEAEIASEADFGPFLSENTLSILVSQSGETADTLFAAKKITDAGGKILSIVNSERSSLERISSRSININAGPEIGVASTKAFTAQLLVLLRLAIKAGIDKGVLPPERAREIIRLLQALPGQIEAYLQTSKIPELASFFADKSSSIFLGRGAMVPLAFEGALKMKECSYIHTQGYPSGELKHGPIALIEDGYPVVCIAPKGATYTKSVSAMEEVAARGARVIMLTDCPEKHAAAAAFDVLPECDPVLSPILYAVPLQLLALHVATNRGLDVDRPRNLAKSVTVM